MRKAEGVSAGKSEFVSETVLFPEQLGANRTEALGRNGGFLTIGVNLTRSHLGVMLNPITSRRQFGRCWIELHQGSLVDFAAKVFMAMTPQQQAEFKSKLSAPETAAELGDGVTRVVVRAEGRSDEAIIDALREALRRFEDGATAIGFDRNEEGAFHYERFSDVSPELVGTP